MTKVHHCKAAHSAVPERFGDERGQVALTEELQLADERIIAVRLEAADVNKGLVDAENKVGQVEYADDVGAPVSNVGEHLVGQLEAPEVVIAQKGRHVAEGFNW